MVVIKSVRRRRSKKKMEFGQKIVLAVLSFTMVCTLLSYTLCFLGLASNEALTTSMWGAGGAAMVCISYFAYQYGLKNSRNKYGIDENGIPNVNNNI